MRVCVVSVLILLAIFVWCFATVPALLSWLDVPLGFYPPCALMLGLPVGFGLRKVFDRVA